MKADFLPKIVLVFIVLLGFLLRFHKITEIPPSLNWDEVSIGYNAYSILRTGKDEWGEFLPLHFKSYGEYKLPVQIYASILGIYFFGLNEFGLRITPVIYGTLSVLLLYLLAKKIFDNRIIGLLAAFFLAISPWHIHLTRASFESSFSVFWVLLAMLWLVFGFEKPKYWILSALSFGVAVYTYNSARVFVPLFLFATLLLYLKQALRFPKHLIVTLGVFILLLLPLVPFVLRGEASARYKLVSITDEAGLVPRINERRGNSSLPSPLPRLVHNKVTYISLYFVQNYLAHFNPEFLFINGAGHKQHHVQGIGELYIAQAPFLVVGAWLLLKSKNRYKGLLFSWLLLTFIPVATTQDSIPNALRTVIAAPVLQIFTAFGIWMVLNNLKAKKPALYLFVLLVTAILAAGFYKYLNLYVNQYPTLYSRDWQYGNKEAVAYIKDSYDKYDLIVYSRHYGEPHMFTLFYLGWDPMAFMSDSKLSRFESFDWIRVLSFDRFYFPDLGDHGTKYQDILDANPNKRILFIGKPGDFPKEAKTLKELYFLNGKKAFEIVE